MGYTSPGDIIEEATTTTPCWSPASELDLLSRCNGLEEPPGAWLAGVATHPGPMETQSHWRRLDSSPLLEQLALQLPPCWMLNRFR